MIFYSALSLAILAVGALLVSPVLGISLALVARPFVDATWDIELFLGLKLTEVFGVLIPFLILFHIFFTAKGEQRIRHMPLRWIWIAYASYIIFSSSIIMYVEGVIAGANVLFRHINGFVAFYMVQAFFRTERNQKVFLIALLLAGIFPITIGVFQLITGYQWRVTYSEGLVRNIGLYHDAITVRYYALQTILASLLFSALFLKKKIVRTGIVLAYMLVSFAVMFKAYSKSGVATLTVWALAWTTLQKKFITIGILAAIGIVLGGMYADRVLEDVGQIFHKEVGAIQGQVAIERTFAGRWYIWRDLAKEWGKLTVLQKVFGSGHVALSAHNDYFQMLFHGGIIGLMIYCSLLIMVGIMVLRNLIRIIDPWSVGALMAYVMWMVDTIGLVPSAYPGYQWFVWGVIGLSFRIHMDRKRSKNFSTEASTASPATLGKVKP